MEARYRAKVSAYFIFKGFSERGMRLQWLCVCKDEKEVFSNAENQRDFLLKQFQEDTIIQGFKVE